MPIKTEEEAYEKIIDINRNNEYTTGNLLDYDYFKKHYKLIAIDLSKQQVLQENEDWKIRRSSQCFHYNRKEKKYYIRIFIKSC